MRQAVLCLGPLGRAALVGLTAERCRFIRTLS